MGSTSQMPALIAKKLAAFESLQPEFEACFQFIEDVHGQKRFSSFSVADIVRYLHALWISDCKTGLLSIAKTVKEYEGTLCLECLRAWQLEGDTVSVVNFLYHKLDRLPLADITRQIQAAWPRHAKDGLYQRLLHGRSILLNRGINLLQALDAIFALSEDDLSLAVREACLQYGHLPEQIVVQLEEMASPLYSFVPYQALAQRNMLVMNKLGINVAQKHADLPGQRSWRVAEPAEPLQPFAEHIVQGYQELVSPWHNNLAGNRFVDRPERSTTTTV